MADYEKWLVMARQSFDTADLAKNSGDLRSAASRYYYAAYQATTAALLYRGLTPPLEREAWSHDDTPGVFENDLGPIMSRRDGRRKISSRLRELYRLRIIADYQASVLVSDEAVHESRRKAGYIISSIKRVLPTREQKQ